MGTARGTAAAVPSPEASGLPLLLSLYLTLSPYTILTLAVSSLS